MAFHLPPRKRVTHRMEILALLAIVLVLGAVISLFTVGLSWFTIITVLPAIGTLAAAFSLKR